MWSATHTLPALSANEVHLWKVDVPITAWQNGNLLSLLSDDELERAARFRFRHSQSTYVTARATLRVLLGAYLGVDAAAVCFTHSEYGKPFLASGEPIQFNLSHSGGMVLLGFVPGHEIGVDIEYNKRVIELEEVASRFFSATENEQLMALSAHQRTAAFYRCWTRKEAFIKAKGGGLSIPLDQFEVSLAAVAEPKLHVIRWDQPDVPNWRMNAFGCGPDYTGAAIVHAPNATFRHYDWDASVRLGLLNGSLHLRISR